MFCQFVFFLKPIGGWKKQPSYVPYNIICCDSTGIEQDTFSLQKIFQSNHSRIYIPILINNQLITPGQQCTQKLTDMKAGDTYQVQRYTSQSLATLLTYLNNSIPWLYTCCNSVNSCPSRNRVFVCDHASVNAWRVIPWFYVKSLVVTTFCIHGLNNVYVIHDLNW